MLSNNKSLLGAIAFFLLEKGIDVSGYTNLWASLVLWGVAALFFFVWLWHSLPEYPFQRKFMGPLILVSIGVVCLICGGIWYFILTDPKNTSSDLFLRPSKFDNNLIFNEFSVVPNEEKSKPFQLSLLNRSSHPLADVTVHFEIQDLDIWGLINKTDAFPYVEKSPEGRVYITTKINGGRRYEQVSLITYGGVTVDLIPSQGDVEIDMPQAIKMGLSLYAIAQSYKSNKSPSADFIKKVIENTNPLEKIDLMHGAGFERFVELPLVSVSTSWRAGGRPMSQKFTLRSAYIPVGGPFWVSDETGEHKVQYLNPGGGTLAFEDMNKPDSGFYNAWKRWKESDVPR